MKTFISSVLLFLSTFLQAEDTKAMTPSTSEIAVIETTQGTIEVTLFRDKAPKAVDNFIKLAQSHYYDGTIFHRVIKGFMIQGGDPLGNGTGGQSTWGKPFADEYSPSLTFNRPGLLAMANRGPNTNGSQFFITTEATPWLNNKHTIFGEVTNGMDVVRKIESTPVKNDRPVTEQKIIKITIKK